MDTPTFRTDADAARRERAKFKVRLHTFVLRACRDAGLGPVHQIIAQWITSASYENDDGWVASLRQQKIAHNILRDIGTVKRALRDLDAAGIIKRRPGMGSHESLYLITVSGEGGGAGAPTQHAVGVGAGAPGRGRQRAGEGALAPQGEGAGAPSSKEEQVFQNSTPTSPSESRGGGAGGATTSREDLNPDQLAIARAIIERPRWMDYERWKSEPWIDTLTARRLAGHPHIELDMVRHAVELAQQRTRGKKPIDNPAGYVIAKLREICDALAERAKGAA